MPLRALVPDDLVHLLEQGYGLADSRALAATAVEHEHDSSGNDDLVVPRQRIRGSLSNKKKGEKNKEAVNKIKEGGDGGQKKRGVCVRIGEGGRKGTKDKDGW